MGGPAGTLTSPHWARRCRSSVAWGPIGDQPGRLLLHTGHAGAAPLSHGAPLGTSRDAYFSTLGTPVLLLCRMGPHWGPAGTLTSPHWARRCCSSVAWGPIGDQPGRL